MRGTSISLGAGTGAGSASTAARTCGTATPRAARSRRRCSRPTRSSPTRGAAAPTPSPATAGTAVARELAGGFLGAGTGNDEYAIGYFDGDDVPFTRELAQRFTVFDHWHAPLMAGTFPNRQYLHSATSDGRKEDPIPLRVGIFEGPTIWDRLPPAACRRATTTSTSRSSRSGAGAWTATDPPIDDYFTDAAAGRLPSFVMLDPGFRGAYRTDDHSWADVRYGQRIHPRRVPTRSRRRRTGSGASSC